MRCFCSLLFWACSSSLGGPCVACCWLVVVVAGSVHCFYSLAGLAHRRRLVVCALILLVVVLGLLVVTEWSVCTNYRSQEFMERSFTFCQLSMLLPLSLPLLLSVDHTLSPIVINVINDAAAAVMALSSSCTTTTNHSAKNHQKSPKITKYI